MRPQVAKWTRFWLVFAIWLVADLWSKHWADTSLATSQHPLPVTVTAEEAGKPIKDVLTARFGWDEATIRSQLGMMERLAPAITASADDKPFAPGAIGDSARGLWVFWRSERTLPPRRLTLSDRSELSKWLALAVPDATPESVNTAAREAAGAKTFAAWMPQMFRKIDSDDVAGLLAEGRVHPILRVEAATTPETMVAAGDTWLVMQREMPVMGEWWKFAYAENPGAAFGFMKGVSPGLRQLLFFLLTLVAFVVIGSIVTRLPPTGWVVATGFAAILAGAAGNFIDRVRYGYVIDFIDMDLGFTHWPTYNVADIAIAVGVITLLLDMFFNKNSLLATKKPAKADA